MAKKNTTKAFTDYSRIDMTVRNAQIFIRDIIKGYVDNSETEVGGISSMDGRLNIRPRYQRSYIADTANNWRENLINSIICGFPINRIYIGVDEEESNTKDCSEWALEMLDGQQRTKTICDYVNGDFTIEVNGMKCYFHNLTEDMQEKILNYPVDVTYCIGDEDARIAWFRRINQPNSILVPQELRNAVYRGTWCESAKKFFSASSSKSKNKLNDKSYEYYFGYFTKGRSIERAEYLELAIDWIAYDKYADLRSNKDEDERICKYMSEHMFDENADELIEHYKKVIDWVKDVFLHNNYKPKSYQSFQSQEWGRLYSEYHNIELTEEQKKHITERCAELVSYVVTNTFYDSKGIYEWVIRGENEDESRDFLCFRNFKDEDKANMYKRQGGIDPLDGKHYELSEMHAHHIEAWGNGGNSDIDNMVLLSKENHRKFHNNFFGITNKELKDKRDAICKK